MLKIKYICSFVSHNQTSHAYKRNYFLTKYFADIFPYIGTELQRYHSKAKALQELAGTHIMLLYSKF